MAPDNLQDSFGPIFRPNRRFSIHFGPNLMFLAPTGTLVSQDLRLAWPWTSPIAAGKPGPLSETSTSVLSQQQTSVISQQRTSVLCQQQTCPLLQEQTSVPSQHTMLKSQIGVALSSSNGACPKPAQAQILADQSSGRGRKHQIWSEMGRESTVWPETKAK